MQTPLVPVRRPNPKTALYVGGLEESVNEAVLHAAFIPFGDIKDVTVPLDNATGKHRGFGFVEYDDPADAAAAVDNLHNAELYGRTLRVNYAQPARIKGGDKGVAHQAVWADADDWYDRAAAEAELEKLGGEGTNGGGSGGGGTGAGAPVAADDPMARAEAEAGG